MNKLCTIYPYGINKSARKSKLEQPTGKLFPPLPRLSNRRENLEKRLVSEPTKFDTTDTILAHIATFLPKNRTENVRRILGGMKKKISMKVSNQMQLMS